MKDHIAPESKIAEWPELKQRIAQLEAKECDMQKDRDDWIAKHAQAQKRIAELEASVLNLLAAYETKWKLDAIARCVKANERIDKLEAQP